LRIRSGTEDAESAELQDVNLLPSGHLVLTLLLLAPFWWALLVVVATSAVMEKVGLSMSLGAFLSGVMLAESEYRHELHADIEPFKGLLLGLFFIAVGMSIDFAVVLAQPLLVAAIVAGFLLVKAAVLWGMGRAMPIPARERPPFLILLAQGGEFGFVVFQSAATAGVIDAPSSSSESLPYATRRFANRHPSTSG